MLWNTGIESDRPGFVEALPESTESSVLIRLEEDLVGAVVGPGADWQAPNASIQHPEKIQAPLCKVAPLGCHMSRSGGRER